jgi:hypothetical protein
MNSQTKRDNSHTGNVANEERASYRYRFLERLIVSFFVFVGLYMLFILVLDHWLRMLPKLDVDMYILSYVCVLLYLPLAYLLWRNWKAAFVVTLGSILAFYVFSIIFFYTFFIWLAFGPLCLVYAFVTGLFVDAKDNNNQNARTRSGRLHPFVTKPFIGVVLLLLLFSGSVYVSFYGFSFDACLYATREYDVPLELQNKKIKLERDAYIVQGQESLHCTDILEDISLQLVNAETINRTLDPHEHYSNQGMSFEPVASGTTFMIQNYVGLQNKGLLFTSFYDQGDYMTVLVLTDEQGNKYTLKTTELDFQPNRMFVSYPDQDGQSQWLSLSFFTK